MRTTPLNVVEGQVFLIPHDGKFIAAQVCEGLDLAVFDGLWDIAPEVASLGDPRFRVHFAFPTIRRHQWKAVGQQRLTNGLKEAVSYGHRAVGSDECYRVTHGKDDQLIACDEAANLEPLATWSHEHIIRRFDDPTYRG
jgi:hypothetical protein